MPTNLAIDDRLLEEARRVGGQRTKKATVTDALAEYIQRRKQAKILKLFGTIGLIPTTATRSSGVRNEGAGRYADLVSGVQGSNTDFLICAVASRNDFRSSRPTRISRISPGSCRSRRTRCDPLKEALHNCLVLFRAAKTARNPPPKHDQRSVGGRSFAVFAAQRL